MGDCGNPQFTHVATDLRIVRDNLNGGNRTTQGRRVPFCIFTAPETDVGLSESEAQKRAVLSTRDDPNDEGTPRSYVFGNARVSIWKAVLSANARRSN